MKTIMNKKIISFVVALALTVSAGFGAFPRLLEGAAENTEDGDSVYPVKVDEVSFPDENFRNYIKELISELGDKEVTEQTTEEPEEITETEEITEPVEVTEEEPVEVTEPEEVTEEESVEITESEEATEDESEESTEEESEESTEEEPGTVMITGPATGTITVPITVSNEIIIPETTAEEPAEEVDKDYWLTWEIASQITEIDVSGMEIQSLVGIEYFFALETLKCSDNEISELNLSNNKELEVLDCSNNGISELDLNNNGKLAVLDCSYNEIAELDLSNNGKLAVLDCSNNEIAELDLSNNGKLAVLDCSNNEIAALDLSNKKELAVLDCSYNDISELYLNSNSKLVSLDCCNNNIAELNLSRNTELEALCCSDNPITPRLDLSYNTNLRNLECSNTNIIALYLGDRNDVPFETFEVQNNGTTIKLCSPEFDITELPDYGERFTSGNFNGNPEFNEKGTLLINIEDGLTYTYDYDTEYRYEGPGRAFEDDGIVTFYITFLIASDEGHKLEKVENDFVCSNVDGLWVWRCSRCGRYFADENGETEAIVRDAHSSDEYECNFCQHWQICSICGREFGREYHDVDPVTNSCIICGENFDHNHDLDAEFVPEIPPTCTEDGMLAHYYCEAHKTYYYEYADGHIAEIPREELIIEALGHDYRLEWNEEAHWEECTRCHDKINEWPHAYDHIDIIDPTCTEDGKMISTCNKCGYIDEETIEALGHNFSHEWIHDENGHWHKCTRCDETGMYELHNWDDGEEQDGIITYTCLICEATTIRYSEPDETSKPDESEPEITKPDETKPDETKPDETKPDETKPEETKPDETKPGETKPDETKPGETKPDETKPGETKPDETRPEETKPDETKPGETKPDETRPEETKPDETKPEGTKPNESKPSESEPAGSDPTVTNPKPNESDVIIATDPAATTKAPTAVGPGNDANNGNGGGDNNLSTGFVFSLIPAAISGAMVVISKKRKK